MIGKACLMNDVRMFIVVVWANVSNHGQSIIVLFARSYKGAL